MLHKIFRREAFSVPQDAFTIKYVAKELEELLAGGKISKITQQNRDMLTFIIYTRKGTVKLETCFSAKGCRLNVCRTETPAPKVAPAFCMLLRKHLQNAEIKRVEQTDGERIVRFDFLCNSEFELKEMSLYCELMGKYSNAVLCENGIIAGALKTTAIGESTRRVLFTGAKYVLPAPQDKVNPENLNALEEVFKGFSGDFTKLIADRVLGVAYSTALEICGEFNQKPTAHDVNRYICGDITEPCVTFLNGEPNDFKVKSVSADKRIYPTVLEAQTAFYAYVTQKQTFEEVKRRLYGTVFSAIKKLEKRIATFDARLFECRDMDLVKLKGELITANIYAVKRGCDSFEAVNYYDEKGGTIKIALDKSLSPAENAQRYYKKYAKLKRTLASVSGQKRETGEKLDYLNSIEAHICAAETLLDLEETEEELKICGLLKEDVKKKKMQKISPFREFLCGGFRILAGRNNLQNDRLLKSVSPQDIWLHTQNYHSSHVVIVTEGKTAPEEVVLKAAEICAYYSDGRGASKVPVDYCRRKSVKKPPKSNAGFVIYTDYKTLLAEPDGHGELLKDEN